MNDGTELKAKLEALLNKMPPSKLRYKLAQAVLICHVVYLTEVVHAFCGKRHQSGLINDREKELVDQLEELCADDQFDSAENVKDQK